MLHISTTPVFSRVFLAIFFVSLIWASTTSAQGTPPSGGGGSTPNGIAGVITEISGTSGAVTIKIHLYYTIPFTGPYNCHFIIGKLAEEGSDKYESAEKLVIPAAKRIGPADHTFVVNLKVPNGKFDIVFNTDSDVGPNSEYQMFWSTFELVDGQVQWSADNNGNSLGVGGPVIAFPYSVPTAPGCLICWSNILGTLVAIRKGVVEKQGDSQQTCSTTSGQDVQRLYGPSSSVSGCGSCAGGGSTQAGGTGFEFKLMSSVENSVIPTGAGLGYGSELTEEAYLVTKSDESVKIRYMDVGKVTTFSDRVDPSDPIDGKCYDEFGQYKELRLLQNGTLQPVLEFVNEMEVEYYDGSIKYYAVKNDDEDKAGDQYAVLTGWKDINGHGISFNRDTGVVTGPFGETITINMNTVIAGRDSISSVQFGTATANFTYSGFHLSKVEITENGTNNVVYRWTNQVGVDSGTGAVTWTTENPATGRKVVYYSPDHGGFDGHVRSIAANKMLKVERGAENSEQVSLTISTSSTVPNRQTIVHGNNVATFEQQLGQWQRYHDGTGDEATFATNYWNPQGGVIGTTPPARPWTVGAPDYRIEENGVRVDLEYDSDYFLTKRIWGKGQSYETFELFQYDQHKNLTFYRDRNGCVTSYVYNAKNLLIEKHVGQKDANGDGTVDLPNPPEYAVYTYTYNANDRIEEERDPLYSASHPTLHRTRYEYDGQRRLIKIIEAAFTTGGAQGETVFTYDSSGRIATVTDPVQRTTTFSYDSLNRKIKTTYNDGSTEETLYGSVGSGSAPNLSMKVFATKDRNNVVTTYTYDWLGRLTEQVRGAAVDSTILDGVQNLVTDPTQKIVTTYTYVAGLDLVSTQTSNGRKKDNVYDYRMRVVESTQYPNTGKTLTKKTKYVRNQVFYTEDPYGRREYRGYRAHDGELLRRIQGTVPTFSVVDNDAVLNKVRDTSLNAKFIVDDAIKDATGQLIEIIDGREVTTKITFDCRGREIQRKEAFGTADERKTENDYDLANNLIETRSPRFFDASDTNGHNRSKTTFTYNGRNLLASQTSVFNSTQSATTSKEYFADGRLSKTVDARGYQWHRYWHSCCGRFLGQKDPAGHGSYSNTDYMGRVTHSAKVADYATHSNSHNPIDALTLNESTVRYDALGRRTAQTMWFAPEGTVDSNNVPIAGLGGVAKTDGSTVQSIYDDNLADGIGLDSTTGVVVNKLGGGTYNISLTDCLTKLADTTANGGAGISFTAGQSAGSAIVSIDAEERLSVTISDGTGRAVMSAVIEPHHGTNPSSLITWSCTQYDTLSTITGVGDCLETWSINALGNVNKTRVDGASRTLEQVDADNNITTAKYDAAGNLIESRNPSGIGIDRVYDNLGRVTSQTDTRGDSTSMTYNLAGQIISQIDAKNKTSSNIYDAGGRLTSKTDRNTNATTYTYDLASNQLTVVDAENSATAYEYNSRGLKFRTTYPDHTGGVPGDSSYGIVDLEFDAAGRLSRKTDQAGDTITYNYDMANRLLQRDYRTKANSPSGTIADSDTFTLNSAGQILTATSGRYSNVVTFVYDNAGRKSSESLTIDGQTYTSSSEYDTVNRLSKLTHPYGDEIERTYTSRGQLYQVKHDGSVVDTRTYDVGGRLDTSTYGNGVVTDYDYVANDNLVSDIKTSHPSGVVNKIGDYSYTYDANKNKTSESITGAMAPYGFGAGTTYDDDDRLTAWNRTDGNLNHSWNLSAVGNWTSQTINTTTTNRTHNAVHEISTIGSATLQHDTKGNLTVSPGRELVFDQDNQLVSAIAWGNPNHNNTRSFKYDALHRRVAETSNQGTSIWVNAGQQLAAIYPSGATPTTRPTNRFIFGSYIDEPIMMFKHTTKHYFHRNQQYSITGCTDSSGEVSERYAYDAYGKTTILAPNMTNRSYSVIYNTFMYTGRAYRSSTGLYYFRARWYDGKLGRFVSRDPLEYVDGMSMMKGYMGLGWTDPKGLSTQQEPHGPLDEGEEAVGHTRHGWPIYRKDGKCYIKSYHLHTRELISTSSVPCPKGPDEIAACCEEKYAACLDWSSNRKDSCLARGSLVCSVACMRLVGLRGDKAVAVCVAACLVPYTWSCSKGLSIGNACCRKARKICIDSGRWPKSGWWIGC